MRKPPIHFPLTLFIACFAIASFAALPRSYALTPRPHLILLTDMDHHEFLPGEPIMIGITVRNFGEAPFPDLSPLDPRFGRLTFAVKRHDQKVRWWHTNETWVFTREGMELAAGAELCEVFDLRFYFGSRKTIPYGEKSIEFGYILEPGSYSVQAFYRAHSGVRKELPKEIVRGNEVRVVVRDSSSIPSSEASALDLLQPEEVRTPPYVSTSRWKRIHDQRLEDSRYFLDIVNAYLPYDSIEASVLAREILAGTGEHLTAASILTRAYWTFGKRFNACETWIHRVRTEVQDSDLVSFIRTFDSYLAFRRKLDKGDD